MCMNAVEEPGEVTQDCQMLQSEWHMILESHGHSVERLSLLLTSCFSAVPLVVKYSAEMDHILCEPLQ